MRRILIVDDQKTTVSFLSRAFRRLGYETLEAYDGEQAFKLYESGQPDMVVTDLRMEPVDGIRLLGMIREKDPELPVVIITAVDDIEPAVEAMRLGAFDYLIKPFVFRHISAVVNRALAYRLACSGTLDLKGVIGSYSLLGEVVTQSAAMQTAAELARRAAPADSSVLVWGEKGSGRAKLAAAIHELSPRRGAPFVAMDCEAVESAVSRGETGLLERNTRGTIFFSDVDIMSPDSLRRLLGKIDELRTSDGSAGGTRGPRLMCSARTELRETVDGGNFDKDLRSAVCGTAIEIKPLRERKQDVLPIVYHVLRRDLGAGAAPMMDMDVALILENYAWPGNVAELEQVAAAVAARGKAGRITRDDLPENIVRTAGVNAVAGIDLKSEFLQAEALKAFLKEKSEENIRNLHKPAEEGQDPVPGRCRTGQH